MSRSFAFAVAVLLFPAVAQARLDPETNKPYDLRIILQLGPQRAFTPAFRERLHRGLHDHLQSALDKFGNVRIIDAATLTAKAALPDRLHKLYQQVQIQGLKAGLDNWKEISETKTHFVLVDCADGVFTIRARQFDGLTGLPSPLVREATTGDREFVLRLALYLIDQDFGVVGTIEPSAKPSEITVTFKAGGLVPDLSPWVKKGDIFAVAQILQTGTGRLGFRRDDTLLRALDVPQSGACRCELLTRYDNPLLQQRAILGYRCLKLGTTKARFKLHLVDKQGKNVTSQPYEVWQDGFERVLLAAGATDRDGYTQVLGPVSDVAFVRVLSGMTPVARFPVEILDDRPVVRVVDVSSEKKQLGQYQLEVNYLLQEMAASQLGIRGVIDDLNRIGQDTRTRDEALRKAKASARGLRADLIRYRQRIEKLRKDLPASELVAAENGFKKLSTKDDEFQHYVQKLEAVVAEEKGLARSKLPQLLERAKTLEREAKFDEAIAAYEELVREAGGREGAEKYAEYVARLKKEWTPGSEEHRKARAFIYRTWPEFKTASDLKAHMEDAQKALQTCIDAGDRRTPLKLLLANTAHLEKLTKQLEKARASTNADEKREATGIPPVVNTINDLTKQATAFVQGEKTGS